jgi:hypothetical protein
MIEVLSSWMSWLHLSPWDQWTTWDPNRSNMVAAIAQVGATLFAFLATVFVGKQLVQGRRSGDLTSLLTFRRDTKSAEDNFLRAPKESKNAAFENLMNHLECYAGAFNDKLFAPTTKKFVRGKLCDSIVLIRERPGWSSKMDEIMTTPRSFAELRKFEGKNKRFIRKATKIYHDQMLKKQVAVIGVDTTQSQVTENAAVPTTNTHS